MTRYLKKYINEVNKLKMSAQELDINDAQIEALEDKLADLFMDLRDNFTEDDWTYLLNNTDDIQAKLYYSQRKKVCHNKNKKSNLSARAYPHGPLATTADTAIAACCVSNIG